MLAQLRNKLRLFSRLCKRKNTVPTIFPLSAKRKLDEKSMSGIKIYNKYLKKAFSNKNIRNIVVTGGFGIGKSSIIRSFEKTYCGGCIGWFSKLCGREKKFLYISLGDYENISVKQEISNGTHITQDRSSQDGGDLPGKNVVGSEEKNKQDILMRRMLLQLYARFHKKDLPASSFEMIREHNKIKNISISVACAFMAAAVLLLAFYDQLAQTVKNAVQWEQDSSLDKSVTLLLDAVKQMAENAPLLHLLLYIAVIVLVTFAAGRIVYYILAKLRAKTLIVKMDRLEAEYENEACENYLDRRTTEIVYCLEQIAPRIKRTVVFEDLDRIAPKTCVDILTRLREINYLLNLRMKHGRQFRFLYVINDSVYASLEYTKFFDYTLPLFASLTEQSAYDIFSSNFSKVNNNLKKTCEETTAFDEVEDKGESGLIHSVSKYLQDYRLQYTILNEYSLLFHLYLRNKSEERKITAEDVESILAFAIYKVCWPDDYNRIAQGKSVVLPVYTLEDTEKWKRVELLKVLTGGENVFLTSHCLYVAGYQQDKVIDSFLKNLNKQSDEGKIAAIRGISLSDSSLIRGVCQYTGQKRHSGNENEEKTICTIMPPLMELFLKTKAQDVSWFYERQKLRNCIDLLLCVKNDNIETFNKFIELSKERSNKHIFETCSDYKQRNTLGSYTKEEQELLKRGQKVN